MDALARELRGLASGQPSNRTIEALARPPIRITPREVHRNFHPGAERLAQLVAREEPTNPEARAGRMELSLLRVRAIVPQPVVSPSCGVLLFQNLEQHRRL